MFMINKEKTNSKKEILERLSSLEEGSHVNIMMRFKITHTYTCSYYTEKKNFEGHHSDGSYLASYPDSLIIAGEEKRAWFQSLTHAPNCPGIPGRQHRL